MQDDSLYTDLKSVAKKADTAVGTVEAEAKNVRGLVRDGQETLRSVRQGTDALQKLPIVRGYVEDATAILVRPTCRREAINYSTADLFEPGSAILTEVGKGHLEAAAERLKGPGHARHAAKLEAALRERGRLLGELAEPDPQWLTAIELQIAEAGAAVAQARARLVGQLSAALEQLPEAPFARPALGYQPGGPLDPAELTAALTEGRRRDRAAQRTLVGPHRDELAVSMAGKDEPASTCSTGEQKAMLIAITLAHAQLLSPDRPGVLLLDEVAAHLDPLRREALFERLAGGSAQVWLTGTELAPFDAIAGTAAVWQVSGGRAERVS